MIDARELWRRRRNRQFRFYAWNPYYWAVDEEFDSGVESSIVEEIRATGTIARGIDVLPSFTNFSDPHPTPTGEPLTDKWKRGYKVSKRRDHEEAQRKDYAEWMAKWGPQHNEHVNDWHWEKDRRYKEHQHKAYLKYLAESPVVAALEPQHNAHVFTWHSRNNDLDLLYLQYLAEYRPGEPLSEKANQLFAAWQKAFNARWLRG